MPVDAVLGSVVVGLLIAAVLVVLARDVCYWASGRAQLSNAVAFQDAAAVRKLLDAAPQLAADPEALFSAIFSNCDEILAVLLERGADVRRPLEWGGAALHIAARYGTAESVRAVLAHGADIDEDCRGTPLYWAADQGRLEMVELLLRCGANASLVPLEEVGRSAFKKPAVDEWFEPIRRRLVEAAHKPAEPGAAPGCCEARDS